MLKACAAAPVARRERASLAQDLRQVLPAGHRPSAARCISLTAACTLYYHRRDSTPSTDFELVAGGHLKEILGAKMVCNHTHNEWPHSRAAPRVSGPRTSRFRGAFGVAAAAQTTPRFRGHSGRIQAARPRDERNKCSRRMRGPPRVAGEGSAASQSLCGAVMGVGISM